MRRPLNLNPTAIPIWHQQPQCARQSFSPSLPVTSLHDAPFCRFCLANNHPTMQCSAAPPQTHVILITTRGVNVSSIARRPRQYPSNSYRGRSRTKHGSTRTMQCSINVSNMHPLLNRKIHLRAGLSQKCLRHSSLRKTKSEGQEDGNLCAIQPSAR